jgi:hypothetical protein
MDEPQFLVSQVEYKSDDGRPDQCDVLDVLNLYNGKKDQIEPGKVITVHSEEEVKIQSARLIVVPVYSIESRQKVTELIQQVRQSCP